MHSHLDLKSELGQGSEFSFVLEVRYSDEINDSPKPAQKSVTNETHNNVISTDNKLVYIVEDNKINMLLAKTLVKQILPNAEIVELQNGKEALEKNRKFATGFDFDGHPNADYERLRINGCHSKIAGFRTNSNYSLNSRYRFG